MFGGESEILKISTGLKSGNKLLIIKDTGANSVVPYFACNYDEIVVVDYRLLEGDLKSVIKGAGINEVLFLNGIMDANTQVRVSALSRLID